MASGTKVRFLGCVHAYYGEKGQLLLRNHYPATAPETPTALVNIDSVLSDGQNDFLQVGAWLNVVGNVRELSKSIAMTADEDPWKVSRRTEATVVDATMIWSAGAIKLERYQTAAQRYQKPLGTG
ncbi:uncharacterized protein LTR77_006765 [Saxophila tyrrhenica]|uniref:Uncharacterized protein n=1 Tax=Saxophila tyrrhenica TaxID=1690608 RepID=A0AAV9P9W1_9PEZI|nr:hypothetical protein LTR77_006765 [Saxophila tyrrhenica]